MPLTKGEFEELAARMGELEDYLQNHEHGAPPAERRVLHGALTRLVSIHAFAQLLIEETNDELPS